MIKATGLRAQATVEASGAFVRHGAATYLGAALTGDLRGLRRLRVGDYRVLYEVGDDELIVLVVRVAHRRDAYRRTRA